MPLTRSIRDSESSIDFVQGRPGSRRERVNTSEYCQVLSSVTKYWVVLGVLISVKSVDRHFCTDPGAHFIELVINDLSFTDYYHGNSAS